jgi:uncharacterized protein YciI
MPKELFLVERPNGPEWIEGNDARDQELWDEHAAFMDALFDAGHVVLGGRLKDESGALLVMDADGEEHVRALLAPDPWVVERDMLRVGDVRPWKIFLDARER